MIEDIALYIHSNQWILFLTVFIGGAIGLAGILIFTERDKGSYILLLPVSAFIAILMWFGPAIIERVGLDQLTEDSAEQSTGILISSEYDTDDDHYDVKIWDADHNEVDLVYPEDAFTFKPGDHIEFTSYINYHIGHHNTDTRTLRQMNYAGTD